MNFVSKRISNLVQSDIRAMTQHCVARGGINLGQGLCELPTPDPIVAASQQALQDNALGTYSPAEGVLELRQVIAKKLKEENGLDYSAEKNIVVTIGATGGYASALMSLLNPGDGVIIFEPYYGYHVNSALLAELEPQYVPMSGPDLAVDIDAIEKTIQPNTRAMVLCTPGNPSGKMYSEAELTALGELAKKHDLLVISDEMYEYFRYDGRPHISPASIPSLADRTITMMGLSKTYSMTGWRLGYLAAPEELAEKIKLANDLFYVCAPTPLQHGVIAGFKMDGTYYKDLQADFQQRRDRFCSVLEEVGLTPLVPQGAYYVLADITSLGFDNSKDAAMAVLEKVSVASVPGRAFFRGEMGNKYLRFCFAVEEEKLTEAMKKLLELKGGL